MFPGRNGAGGLIGDAVEITRCHIAKNGTVGVVQSSQYWITAGEACAIGPTIRSRVDQLCFAAVPLVEQFHRRGTADQTWVRDAGEAHAGDVA